MDNFVCSEGMLQTKLNRSLNKKQETQVKLVPTKLKETGRTRKGTSGFLKK